MKPLLLLPLKLPVRSKKLKANKKKTLTTAKVKQTPNQVMKTNNERSEKLAQLQKAYAWSVSQKQNYEN